MSQKIDGSQNYYASRIDTTDTRSSDDLKFRGVNHQAGNQVILIMMPRTSSELGNHNETVESIRRKMQAGSHDPTNSAPILTQSSGKCRKKQLTLCQRLIAFLQAKE